MYTHVQVESLRFKRDMTIYACIYIFIYIYIHECRSKVSDSYVIKYIRMYIYIYVYTHASRKSQIHM